MIYVIFAISVFLGGCVAFALRRLDRMQIAASEIEPNRLVAPTAVQLSGVAGLIGNLEQVEQQIANSIQEMATQKENLASQQFALEAKSGREGLIARYEKDQELLARQIQAQKRAGGVAWRTIQLLRMRELYGNTIKKQPQLSIPKSPEEVDDVKVYTDSISEMKAYLNYVCTVREELASTMFSPPEQYTVPEKVLLEMADEQEATVGRLNSLIERLDRSIDCLIYFENWVNTNRLNVRQVELPKHDELLRESLTEISVVMSDLQDLAENEEAIFRDLSRSDVEEKILKITNAAIDMESRIDAENEIAQLFSSTPVNKS